MKKKRKPIDFLVSADGYLFSSGGLYIKYFQKIGRTIVVGYFGNLYSNEVFVVLNLLLLLLLQLY